MIRWLTVPLAVLMMAVAGPAAALELRETPTLKGTHGHSQLPPVAARVPLDPLIVDLPAKGREIGHHGGNLRTLIGRSQDVRLMVVWGYARLVGYDDKLQLRPDILKAVDVEDERVFTFHLRRGHRWSDGHPFSAEDFRYYWEDIANNPELTPAGPLPFMLVDGKPPVFEVLDETTVRYSWAGRNPAFLNELAKARPPFIYRPAHALKRYHVRYADPVELEGLIKEARVRNWAALHNRLDEMYNFDNPDLPTLQPWVNVTRPPARRYMFVRNPYFHRVDTDGQQLPYIDRVIMTVADGRLIPAKTNAGESDLQARVLAFKDIVTLKQGEASNGYHTLLWPIAKGSQLALYPDLTIADPVWRDLLRDRRFRIALSLGIDRRLINRAIYFDFATEGNNTALPESPLYQPKFLTTNARFDPAEANRLLDEVGLDRRDANGWRLLPDGRKLEVIVETAGESAEEIDILQLIGETWKEIGVKIFIKPSQRDVLRNRAYAGQTIISVWSGWDNGVPTANMRPDEIAPVHQDVLVWPKWGQYYETKHESGEPIDMPAATELMDLFEAWHKATTLDARARIWARMLEIHAEEQFTIGTVMGVRQPVAVSDKLRNVPDEAFFGWDPGANFGVHRMDEFWFSDEPQKRSITMNKTE